jgi:hypothetical protein
MPVRAGGPSSPCPPLDEASTPPEKIAPEIATAALGGNAPVATEVAIAFAVSWKPLVKSVVDGE